MVVLLVFWFICLRQGLKTTSEFSHSFVTPVSLFMFDNLKFISQERSELQPKTDDVLEFLFFLLYNLCFSPFLLSLATAFHF